MGCGAMHKSQGERDAVEGESGRFGSCGSGRQSRRLCTRVRATGKWNEGGEWRGWRRRGSERQSR